MRRLLLASLLAVLCGGCANQDMSDLRAYVEGVKGRAPGGIKPIPEVKQVDTYLYQAADRRDPFTAQRNDAEIAEPLPSDGIQPDFNRRKEELEAYSLDSLRMVGTLEQDAQNWGLIKSNDGTIHRVRLGNYIGRNHGRIIAISEDKIELIELVRQGSGYLEKVAALALGEE